MVSETRRKLLAKVHIARKELSMGEEEYRTLLDLVFGRSSAKYLTNNELRTLIDHFRAAGWKPGRTKRPSDLATNRQMGAIIRLWRKKTDGAGRRALGKWLRHYWREDSLRNLPRKKASKIIAVLEKKF